MAGGIFVAQNKIRPGVYINFKAIAKNQLQLGNRGVCALVMPLGWGEKAIKLTAEDLTSKTLLSKIGATLSSDNTQPIREAFKNAKEVIIARTVCLLK